MSFFDYPSETPAAPTGPVDVLLADASDAEWTTLLEHTQQHRFGPGEAIVTEGEHDRSLYLVLEGELELLIDGKPPLKVKAGESYQIPEGAVHDAKAGDKPFKVLGVYVVKEGQPLASPAP